MIARIFYVGVAVLPFGVGIGTGKAFLDRYVAAAVGTIMWVRASRLVAVGAGAVAAAALIGVIVAGDQLFTKPVQDLLDKERNQSSYGGSSGRGALALDALSIWQEAPFLGVGPVTATSTCSSARQSERPTTSTLNILVEFGLLGLAGGSRSLWRRSALACACTAGPRRRRTRRSSLDGWACSPVWS